jgi:hypothetical protein
MCEQLHQMNCGPKLISHLQTLYNGANSAVLNYGKETNWFQLLKSARKGDRAAAYIFIILLEILLMRLRRHMKSLKLDTGPPTSLRLCG